MKKIMLTGKNGLGKFALVDNEDYERVNKNKWFVAHGYPSKSVYIGRRKGKNLNYQQRLHREVMGLKPYDPLDIDHIDNDKFNAQKANLRFCDQGQNNRNKPLTRLNKSGIKGVSWKSSHSKWCVQISHGGVIHIGLFEDKEEAAYIYDQFAMQLQGEFARTNYDYS